MSMLASMSDASMIEIECEALRCFVRAYAHANTNQGHIRNRGNISLAVCLKSGNKYIFFKYFIFQSWWLMGHYVNVCLRAAFCIIPLSNIDVQCLYDHPIISTGPQKVCMLR